MKRVRSANGILRSIRVNARASAPKGAEVALSATLIRSVEPTGAIERDTYVMRVGPHVYTLRTLGVGTDDKGEYALVEPYAEPFDSGLWLRVEAEPDEWSPAKPICCRVSLQRANPI